MIWIMAATFQEEATRLYGFPAFVHIGESELPVGDYDFLKRVARDTFKYFLNISDKETGLVLDNIILDPPHINAYTNITNVGLQLACLYAGYDLGFVSKKEASRRIGQILDTLQKLKSWRGFLYNYYLTASGKVSSTYVSSVDSAWLAAGLVIVAETFPEHKKTAEQILKAMDFSIFYDEEVGQMYLGYDDSKKEFPPYHYGLICTEARMITYIAIGKGDVPREHFFRVYRTLPPEWTWQRQQPQGYWTIYENVDVFEGYYEWEGIKIVPSWGGSLFEFLMPTMFVDEKKFASKSFGENNRRAVEAHMKFAQQLGYPVWGFSPCSVPDGSWGGYHEFGVAPIGCKGYEEHHVVTPHVSALAIIYKPKAAIDNLREFVKLGMYGQYGFYDSYDVEKRLVSPRYLALDQAMVLLPIYNYLTGGKLQKIFHKRFPVIEKLISIEEFGYWKGTPQGGFLFRESPGR